MCVNGSSRRKNPVLPLTKSRLTKGGNPLRRLLIACAIGLCTVLAACGGSSSGSQSSTTGSVASSAATSSAAVATSTPAHAATTTPTPTAAASSTATTAQASGSVASQGAIPTPTSAPSQASSSATEPIITRCHADNLAVSLVSSNGAAGHIYGTYQLANKGNIACTLYGFIGAQMYDAQGQKIPTNVVRNGGPMNNQPGPSTVTLAPGAGAPFDLVYTDVPTGNETSCPKAAALDITPPNTTQQLEVPTSMMPCDHGTLNVSAVQQPALPATTSAGRCHTNDLSLQWIASDAGAGHLFSYFGLTNKTEKPCTLFGFVGGQMLDKSGKPLPTKVVRNGGMLGNQPKPTTIVLAPGAAAPFIAETSDVPTGNETTCEQAVSLEITPPDETTQLTVQVVQHGFTVCNHGTINVSPVLPPSVPPAG